METSTRTTPPVEGFHYVYFLHVKDADGLPLIVYVGVTSRFHGRMADHARTKWWWPLVVHDWTFVWDFPTREEANRVEAERIMTLQPPMNVSGRLDAAVAQMVAGAW